LIAVALPHDMTGTHLPWGVRTERIVGAPGDVLVAKPDYIVIRTPDNPTYWWGNFVLFDNAPVNGDMARWMEVFEREIVALQPLCTHRTFAWCGEEAGETGEFIDRGFELVEHLAMACDRVCEAPTVPGCYELRPLAGHDWLLLLDLLVATREARHGESAYRNFIGRRIANWRRCVHSGLGSWFGAFHGKCLVAALGLFAEALPGPDGARLARFQNVVTDAMFRRQGLCAALIGFSTRWVQRRLNATTFVIMADEHANAKSVYQRMGFRVVAHERGMQRAVHP
jgi:hypothetical protein